MQPIALLRKAIAAVPAVIPHLKGRARWLAYEPTAYKTYDYFLQHIQGLVRGVYTDMVHGDFIDTMANLISGQLTQAYMQAFEDAGFTDAFMPEYLTKPLETMILGQYDYVDQYFRDIVDARIDQTPIDPLLARAQLWAGQYDTAYQNATALITKEMGGKLVWVEGDTLEKCNTCKDLDGIVMYAHEWDTLGLRPKNPPNRKIDCEGWHCDCQLLPTDKRRSPNAYGRVEEILGGR